MCDAAAGVSSYLCVGAVRWPGLPNVVVSVGAVMWSRLSNVIDVALVS